MTANRSPAFSSLRLQKTCFQSVECEKYKTMSEDESLKKKERKSAMYQYENMKTKCDFYQTLGRNSESLITRLKLYYFH